MTLGICVLNQKELKAANPSLIHSANERLGYVNNSAVSAILHVNYAKFRSRDLCENDGHWVSGRDAGDDAQIENFPRVNAKPFDNNPGQNRTVVEKISDQHF